MRYKSILLFGAPGSGKGTQGKIIGTIPGFYHSATGDIFRSLDLQSEMGRIFWEYAGKGKLVPDEITIRLWKQYIKGMEMINQFHPVQRNPRPGRNSQKSQAGPVAGRHHRRGEGHSPGLRGPEQDGRAPAPPGLEGKPLRRRQRRSDSPPAGGLRPRDQAGVELLPARIASSAWRRRCRRSAC